MIHRATYLVRTAKCILFLLSMPALAGCTAQQPSPVAPDEVEGPFTWGSAENVMRVRQLWISDQPDEAGLQAARDAGVALVVDLRAPAERAWDESAAATRVGLEYRNIVIPKGDFSDPAFSAIEALVRANPKAPMLIHCSSGNRAAGWLTTHLVRTHGMPFFEALEIGRRAGITKPEIVEKTADYLEEEPPDHGDLQQSVPGSPLAEST